MASRYGAMGGSLMCGVLVSLTLVLTMMIAGAAAQSGAAPAPAVDCQLAVATLADCLTYVTGTDKKPSAACCSELKTVIDTSPQCLCLLFNTSFTKPLGVNITIAQQLPPACKLETPPTSLCALFGVPVPGPVGAVAPSPVTTAPATSPVAPSPTSPVAPSPLMSPTPTTTPSAAPVGSTPASPPAPAMTVPSTGSTVPAGAPPSSNNITTNPNSAPSTTSQNAAVAAFVLLFVSVVLS